MQFGNFQVHSGPKGLIHGASVFDSLLSPRKGRMWARTIPLYIVEILSTFVCPSSAHLSAFSLRNSPLWALILINMVKRPRLTLWWRTLMKRASTSPLQEGILALPHPIRSYRHESFGIRENYNGLVVGEGMFKSQTCCRKFGPAGRAATDASLNPAAPTSFGIVPVKTCSHSGAAF